MQTTIMTKLFTCFGFLLFGSTEVIFGTSNPASTPKKLTEKAVVVSKKLDPYHGKLDLWVFNGLDRLPFRVFSSVELQLNISSENSGQHSFEIYQSTNKSQLFEEQKENKRFFGFFRKVVLWKTKQIDPFYTTYVGIETAEPYKIYVKVKNVDFVRLGVFAIGFLLFFFARYLARNAGFYYTSGAGIGLLASIIIIVFILSKFMPRKSVAYSLLVGGWSFSLYLLYTLWQNLYSIILDHQKFVAIYVITVTLISWGICYRFGPLTNPRSQNLSQWALQFLGLCCIYNGCQIRDIGIAIIFSLLLIYFIPEGFWKLVENTWYRVFPPKRKLLTEEQYRQQGVEETRKELEKLREFCKSPQCDPWVLTGRLQSPTRFASFVSGDSHLTDGEVLNYDCDPSSAMTDEDEEEEETGDSELSTGEESESRKALPSPVYASTERRRTGLVRNEDESPPAIHSQSYTSSTLPSHQLKNSEPRTLLGGHGGGFRRGKRRRREELKTSTPRSPSGSGRRRSLRYRRKGGRYSETYQKEKERANMEADSISSDEEFR